MLGRWQPPVLSPVAPAALVRAVPAVLSRSDAGFDGLARILGRRFGLPNVALTDSGTSALILALRSAPRPHKTVALPAYACVDLLAAAAFVGTRVRLYDIDPATLSPDLDSVRATFNRGVDAIVVAHMYGFPADVPGVAAIAAEHGATVIEDAAQHAAGTLNGAPLGSFGPLTVLSFGRGKGTTGGSGGALLSRDRLADWHPPHAPAGWRDWLVTAAQMAMGRPSLYGIPASLPFLKLGETIYKEAHEPGALSRVAAGLASETVLSADAERAKRAGQARLITERIESAPDLDVIRPIADGQSGYLRLPVLDERGRAVEARSGVVRSYPRSLGEEPIARQLLERDEPAMPGAQYVCKSLFTLPTHARVTDSDRDQIARWARGNRSP